LKLFKEFTKESAFNYEDSQLEKKHPEFASLMREYHEGILLFDLMDKKVWTKAIQDTAGLKAYHQNHKNDYMFGPRTEAYIYTITKLDEADKVAEILKNYTDIAEVRQKFESDSIKFVRIQPGKFENGDNKFVDRCEGDTGLYGPFEADADKFIVYVYLVQHLDSQPKQLEEAKGLITSDYQNFLEKEWLKELRAKHTVIVHKKALEQLKAEIK
jgi:peptidyl-prolyl cis-trans isomerase SurA